MAEPREPVRVGGRLAEALGPLPLAVFLLAVVALPLAYLVGAAASTGTALGAVLADPLNQQALANSIEQGTLSAAAAGLLGFPVGVLLGRYDWPGRSVVRSILIVPFLLPSLVVVLGVEELLGAGSSLGSALPFLPAALHGVLGIVLVNVVFNVPIVAVLTSVGVESASVPLEESLAGLGAPPLERFRRVWGAPAAVGAVAGALLTFVFSALSFAPPLVLCGPRCFTLEGRVWSLSQTLLDPTAATLLAVVTVLVLLLPTVAYLALLDRLRAKAVRGRPTRRALPVRAPALWPLLGTAFFVVVGLGLLLAAVVLAGLGASAPGGGAGSAFPALFGPRVTAEAGLPTEQALVNSLGLAAAAGGIAVVLGVLAGAQRSPGRALRVFRWLPVLVSPVILALALSTFWLRLLGGGAEAWLLILLAQSALAIPFALPGLELARAQTSPQLREAAESLGAPPFVAYSDAELPAVRGALLTTGLLAFAFSLGEFTATNFLSTPTFTTLPVELYHLDSLRATGPASALAALLVLVSLAAFYVVQRGGERVLA